MSEQENERRLEDEQEENEAQQVEQTEALTEEETAGEPEPTDEEKREARKKYIVKELIEWVKALAVALVVVLLLRSFVFTIIRVDGDSMYDTLHNNERLFVTVYDVKFGTVDRGDIVICHYPNRKSALGIQTNFVKRVVAVPGDKVYRASNVTHVVYTDENGETVDEQLDPLKLSPLLAGQDYEITLGEDEYFVVGDNRYNSHDSRASDVGPITGDMIVGHVRQVIWPLSSFRAAE